jgi:hypothetical protein
MQIGRWNVHRRDLLLLAGAFAATLQAASVRVAHPTLGLIIGLTGTFLAAMAHAPRNVDAQDREDDEALERLADDGSPPPR